MSKSNRALVRPLAVILAVGLVVSLALRSETSGQQAQGNLLAGTYPGHTAPSEQRGMNFNSPGVVTRIFVKEGDLVKKGQALAEQDARVEEADLKVQEVDANSNLQIDAAQKTLDENLFELNMFKQGELKKVNSPLDVKKAELEYNIAEARLKLANQEKMQAGLKVEEAKARIAQKKLFATTDGIVQQINVNEGELSSNDPKNPVMMIVTNEPLYVEVDLPTPEAQALQPHQKVQVRYIDESNWQTAEFVYFKPTGNAAANSQHVRFQLENPSHTQSGKNVYVKMGEKVAVAPAAR